MYSWTGYDQKGRVENKTSPKKVKKTKSPSRKKKRTRSRRPPKSGQSSGKPRKKSEKDRLKKEEAEAAAQAELRHNLENEVREREANEQALLDERKRLEEERFDSAHERTHRHDLLDELARLWETGHQTNLDKGVQQRIDAKWARYMLCDGSPDPSDLGEIHTFISLMYEDLKHSQIPDVLEDSKLILKLINELNDIIEVTPLQELTDKLKAQHLETISELQNLLSHKLDIGCQQLLLRASHNADEETANLQKMYCDKDTQPDDSQINICVWANLSKNPRIKNHTFEDINLTFEITKSLMLTDCAIRFQRMRYDHYSARTATYLPRRKLDVIEKVIAELAIVENTVERESSKNMSIKNGGGSSSIKGDTKEAESTKAESVFAVSVTGADTVASQHTELGGASGGPPENGLLEERENVEFEDFVGDLDTIDMRCNHVLGGVFYFNLLQLPPQSKAINRWVMTQVTEPLKLLYIDYQEHIGGGVTDGSYMGSMHGSIMGSARPSLHPIANEAAAEQQNGGGGGEDDISDNSSNTETNVAAEKKATDLRVNEATNSSKQNTLGATPSALGLRNLDKCYIAISMKLPGDVYFCEEPQVVRWNETLKEWRTEGFSDIKFDEEQRMLSLSTADFGIMALVQDAHMNMPFQSWELRPRGQDHVTFTVIAAIVECEFEVKDTLCRLVQPARAELKHLHSTWMKPNHFIRSMRQSGLNIFPDIDSSKYVSTNIKNYGLEQDAYRQMSLTASAVAYGWSKWNAQAAAVNESSANSAKHRGSLYGMSPDKFIVLQSAEHLSDEHLLEEEWFIHLVTKKRTIRLKMTEFSEKFSDDHASGTEFYPSLYHLNKALSSGEGVQRIDASSNDFVHTLHTMLCAVRPLIYS